MADTVADGLLQSSDELAFVPDEVEDIVIEAIEHFLREESFKEHLVSHWINGICERVLQNLNGLEKPFKYIVTCFIMQRTGAGIHSTSSSYYDTVVDGMCTIKWPNDKVKDVNMYCIAHVYGLAF